MNITQLEQAIREAIRKRGVARARFLFRAEPSATNACVSDILRAVSNYDGNWASRVGELKAELEAAERVAEAHRQRISDLEEGRCELEAQLAMTRVPDVELAPDGPVRAAKPRSAGTGRTGKPRTAQSRTAPQGDAK